MSNHFYVYAYCDPEKSSLIEGFTHEPFYIGYGQADRINDHLREASNEECKGNRLKLSKIKKIINLGKTPIIFKLQEKLSKQEAIDLEIDLIAKIGTRIPVVGVMLRGPLTNMHKGGHGGNIPKTEAGRKAISDKLKGRIISPQWRQKISQSHIGKVLSEETKAKVSRNTIVALQDPVRRQKISDTHKGKSKSKEHTKNLDFTF
jgi:hypothetical protein